MGGGIYGEGTVSRLSIAQLSVSPARLSFGTVSQFSLRLSSVTLKNTSYSPISIAEVSVTRSWNTWV